MTKRTYIGPTMDYFDAFGVRHYLPKGANGVYGSYWKNEIGEYVHVFIPDTGSHFFTIRTSKWAIPVA